MRRSLSGLCIVQLGLSLAVAGCDRKETARSEPPASSATATASITAGPTGSAGAKVAGASVDVVADAKQRAKAKQMSDAVVDDIAPVTAPDLDGDGTADTAVPLGLGTVEATLLYLVHGRCAQFVGEVDVATVSALPTKSAGMSDLTGEDASACEGSRAPCKPTKKTYRFDGTAYREVAGAKPAAAAKKPTGATGTATKCGPNQHFDAINKVCRALGECPKGYRWNEPMQSCVDDGG